MPWELVFTPDYHKGCVKLNSGVRRTLDRLVERLQADPFAKISQAVALRGHRQRYRARVGIHYRLLYQIDQKQRRVVLLMVGPRQNFSYQKVFATQNTPTDQAQLREPRIEAILSYEQRAPKPKTPIQATAHEDQEEIEVLEWITEEELYRLQIPDDLWPKILQVRNCGAVEALDLPSGVKRQITDYWTNSGATQVEKLYLLEKGADATTVAEKSLRSFVLALDPEQKAALERLKAEGPYLIKGGAGTGKTLVGLYHIRDLVISRVSEDIFDPGGARYGVLTYTNALAAANSAALLAITPPSAHKLIHSVTLDSIAFKLACSALKRKPNLLGVEGVSNWIREKVLKDFELSDDVQATVKGLGSEYVAEEIEYVINGNGLIDPEEYLAADRRGRKRALRANERRSIWRVHECLRKVCEDLHIHTWEQSRQLALSFLKENPNYPRFSALFVDEAQDLSKIARLLCLELVRSPKFLIFAADTAQSIYTIPVGWKSVHPNFANQGRRSVTLVRGFRSTREISDAIKPLRYDPGDDEDRSLSSTSVFRGPRPKWHIAPIAEHSTFVCTEIRALTTDYGRTSLGQIAIVVRNTGQAERYHKVLSAAGIESHLVRKTSPIDLDAHHIHIMTAHSSKGFDLPIVFVPEVSGDTFPDKHALESAKDEEQREQRKALEKRLLYVALSRASSRLYLLTDSANPCELLTELRAKDWAT